MALDAHAAVGEAFLQRLGEGEKREWLLYAHSPRQPRHGVGVEIPGFGKVTIDVSPGGSFYLVTAKDKAVTPVSGQAADRR